MIFSIDISTGFPRRHTDSESRTSVELSETQDNLLMRLTCVFRASSVQFGSDLLSVV